jgi:hypothetical protein
MRRSRPALAGPAGHAVLPADLVGALRGLARRLRVSLKAVLLAGYLRLLVVEMRNPSPAIAVVSNGRSDRLSDPLGGLGLFWNLLPLQLVTVPMSDAELIRAVQAELSALDQHALYPALQVAERCEGRPELQASFNFVDFHNAARLGDEGGLELVWRDSLDKFHTPLNYAFAVDRAGGGVAVRVEYGTDYFEPADIDRLNHCLLRGLEVFAAVDGGDADSGKEAGIAGRDISTTVEQV